MRPYHDVAGRSVENTVSFTFDSEGQKTHFFLADSYCDNPTCPGWEIAVALAAFEPVERRISFDVNFNDRQMAEVGELSPDDLAIAKEFCNSRSNANLLMRRRQLVRAAGLAEPTGRQGPRKRFTGDCYTLMDFDKHGERFPIFFEIGSDTWSVLDQYCVIPPCSCQDAVLSFYRHKPGETRADPAFSARLDLDSGDFRREDHGQLAPDDKQIVDAFLAGFPGWQHELGLRRSFIRKIATRRVEFPPPRIVATIPAAAPEGDAGLRNESEPVSHAHAAAVTAKVGRNDPCPCGSGKKYKKCCGRAT